LFEFHGRASRLRALARRQVILVRSPARFGRGPSRFRLAPRCAAPARTSSAGPFPEVLDIPPEPRSDPTGPPPLGVAPRCRNAPGSPASRCRTPGATSSPTSSAGIALRLPLLPAGAAVSRDGARASLVNWNAFRPVYDLNSTLDQFRASVLIEWYTVPAGRPGVPHHEGGRRPRRPQFLNSRLRRPQPSPTVGRNVSMSKQLLFNEEARAALMRGVNIMSHAVKVTLGPKGRNVVIAKRFGSPVLTKDGVTVAKEIELKDPYENMGAQMVKEVASKTS